MEPSIHGRILGRIRHKGRGRVFTPKDFSDLGPRGTIDMVLLRLVKTHVLQRFSRGLYFYPKLNPLTAESALPEPHEVAHAMARQTESRCVPVPVIPSVDGTEPSEWVFCTDGRSRRVLIGTRVIVLKRVAPKKMPPDIRSHTKIHDPVISHA